MAHNDRRQKNAFRRFESIMTRAILGTLALFLLMLVSAAAGIGSCLADVLSGYAVYAPATLVIKSLMALLLCLFLHVIHRPRFLAGLLGAIAAETVMVLGYFAYDAFFLGFGMGAAVGIPANLIQAALGIVITMCLVPILKKIPYIFD